MNPNTYFKEIGAWPQSSRAIARTYVVGFVLSLFFTIAAYLMVIQHDLSFRALVIGVIVLACAQFATQVICFLHLGREAAMRERLIVLCCTALIVCILVSGSLWIMFTLNGRMMPSTQQMQQYMNDQEGI